MKRIPAISKSLLVLSIAVMLLGVSLAVAEDKDQSDIAKRIDASAKVLTEIMATPDKAIPDKVMSDAKCIAVIPSMVKIAVGFGGNHGKGVATCRTGAEMERSGSDHDYGRKLGSAAGRRGRRPGADRDQRQRSCSNCSPASSSLARMPRQLPVRLDVTWPPTLTQRCGRRC